MPTLVSTTPVQTTTQYPAGTAPYQISQSAADLLGGAATGVANQLYASPNVTPTEASGAVNDLFSAGLQSTELQNDAQVAGIEDTAQGAAEGIAAQGDQLEAQSYLTAAGVADNNARLARASGMIQQYQEGRQVRTAVGAQTADINAAGFASANHTGAGTALFLQRDSVQQGALEGQLLGENAEIQAGGFEQQSAAAHAEANAATTAAQQADVLGQAATSAGTTIQQNAAAQGSMLTTNALNNAMLLLNTYNPNAASSNPISSLASQPGGVIDVGPAAGLGGQNPYTVGKVENITTDTTGLDPNSAATALALGRTPLQPVGVKSITQDANSAALSATGVG